MERKVNYSHLLIFNLNIKLGPLILRPLTYPHEAKKRQGNALNSSHEHLGEKVEYLREKIKMR